MNFIKPEVNSVLFIKNFLEKNIGIKNLTSVKIKNNAFMFSINAAKFFIDIQTMDCYKYDNSDNGLLLYSSNEADMISSWIKNSIQAIDEMNII